MRSVVRGYNLPGARWYCATGRFATDTAAYAAYTMLMHRLPITDLGIYRHGPPDDPGTRISAVSPVRADVLRVTRLLAARGAVDEELPAELVESMCVRRARVVVEHARSGAPAGRTKIRHAGQGATLMPDGSMREPGGGVG
jgi:hypothetical protein